ncbi:MAG: acetylglutamate kinase [Candidatus Omnitrophica bacterium]|nr:acetylglutamate kinase [Candidatus Omnitrophota bacterium]
MKNIVEKASILIEALPYIKKFRGKEIVIKYGGAAMDNSEMRKNILHDLVFMNYVGIKPILIHGGGPMINQRMIAQGMTPRFVEGLRYTDEETIDIVINTLADINKEMVHDINQFGARAIGLSGHDNEILNVTKVQCTEDIGFVGEVTSVNIMPIRELTEFNIIPVIYPVGYDDKKQAYNVNADEASAKIAIALQAQKMIVLTGTPGIMRDVNDNDSLISTVHVNEVEHLIEQNVVSGGMQPKVKACVEALKGRVQKTHIIDGRLKHSLLLEVFTDQGIGTEIIM